MSFDGEVPETAPLVCAACGQPPGTRGLIGGLCGRCHHPRAQPWHGVLDHDGPARVPAPTSADPGSWQKIEILRRRASRGEELFVSATCAELHGIEPDAADDDVLSFVGLAELLVKVVGLERLAELAPARVHQAVEEQGLDGDDARLLAARRVYRVRTNQQR